MEYYSVIKRDELTHTCTNMDEFQKRYTKLGKLDTKVFTLYDSIYMTAILAKEKL